MGHWKIGVKILCSKSWEGQNSMKAKIWGSKFYFFSRGTLGQNFMFPEKGGQNWIFFPSALKKGGQNRRAYQPTSLKGCPPPGVLRCMTLQSSRKDEKNTQGYLRISLWIYIFKENDTKLNQRLLKYNWIWHDLSSVKFWSGTTQSSLDCVTIQRKFSIVARMPMLYWQGRVIVQHLPCFRFHKYGCLEWSWGNHEPIFLINNTEAI